MKLVSIIIVLLSQDKAVVLKETPVFAVCKNLVPCEHLKCRCSRLGYHRASCRTLSAHIYRLLNCQRTNLRLTSHQANQPCLGCVAPYEAKNIIMNWNLEAVKR